MNTPDGGIEMSRLTTASATSVTSVGCRGRLVLISEIIDRPLTFLGKSQHLLSVSFRLYVANVPAASSFSPAVMDQTPVQQQWIRLTCYMTLSFVTSLLRRADDSLTNH